MCHSLTRLCSAVLSRCKEPTEAGYTAAFQKLLWKCHHFSHSDRSQGCDFTFLKQARSICKQWMLSLPEDCRTQGFNLEEINFDCCPK